MSLTSKQELVVRDFYSEVLTDDGLFANNLSSVRKQLAGACLDMLGYVIHNGVHVRPEDIPPTTFGQTTVLEDRWYADTKACMEAVNGTNSDTSTDEANNSESAKSTEVREAVLSEDV